MSRVYDLDMFRGIAIILVVLTHFAYLYDIPYKELAGIGRYGVLLFYIVSGYTIAYVLDIKKDTYKNFLIKRFFRIAPLFYLCIVLSLLFNYDSTINYIYAFLFLGYLDKTTFNNIIHVEWSIYAEILFYLLIPIFITKTNKVLVFVVTILLTISIVWRIENFDLMRFGFENKQYYMFHPISFLYSFFIGVLIYKFKSYIINKSILYFVIVSMLIVVLALKFYLRDNFFIVADYLLSIFFASLFYLKLKYFSTFRIKPIEYMGVISYSVYLIHYPLMKLFVHFNSLNLIILTILYSLTLILICWLSYKYIETNGIKTGRRMIKND